MIPDQYVWLVWASAFLVPWVALFIAFPQHRKAMRWASLFTAPFGLTEPIFVPRYWNPPSLFGLAQSTGFDLESVIFCFGIGGVGAVLYNVLTKQTPSPIDQGEKRLAEHRFHLLALALPFLVFPILYILPWNPIYAGIVAMATGTIATASCRPDLRRKGWVGGLLFLTYYVIFLEGMELSSPGYIERVWNLSALSGIVLLRMPLEELLFAACFGMYWSSVYEHFMWMRPNVPEHPRAGSRRKLLASELP